MNIKNILVSKRAKAGLLVTATLGSASAFAADHSAAINTAVTDGSANYSLIVTGVITVAAIGFALGMIASKLRN
ncbi:hypothetical protein [Pseudoalteromonas neustonica]|uniref:hypothetical protein n=1 Tax=Pseudoalteromonas neustonica TaxID=1840331 RepID=UPI0007DB4DD0|nr:hypothetical protein [Pseudoalteromonas neustonica]